MAATKLQSRRDADPLSATSNGLSGDLDQDLILKGIYAAQQRLKELNAFDESPVDSETEADGGDLAHGQDSLATGEGQENQPIANRPLKKKRRKSLIEKQMEIKEHVQCIQTFLNTLSAL